MFSSVWGPGGELLCLPVYPGSLGDRRWAVGFAAVCGACPSRPPFLSHGTAVISQRWGL